MYDTFVNLFMEVDSQFSVQDFRTLGWVGPFNSSKEVDPNDNIGNFLRAFKDARALSFSEECTIWSSA